MVKHLKKAKFCRDLCFDTSLSLKIKLKITFIKVVLETEKFEFLWPSLYKFYKLVKSISFIVLLLNPNLY